MPIAGVPPWRLNCKSTMPGTLPSTRTMSLPAVSSASKSSPNTLTATCAVSPLRLSLMRSPRKVTTSVCKPGIVGEDFAQLLLGLVLVDFGVRLELHMEFTAMRSPGILAQFCSAHLLLDALHIGQSQNFGADSLAHLEHGLQ